MKKTILGLAFLTIASFSIQASAQTPGTQCPSQTECASKTKKKCDRNIAKCDKDKKACCKKRQPKINLFEGIELSSDQKDRIEALDNAMKVSRQELKEKAKTARENKDTTYNPRNASRQLRGKYINDLGEILTSDQMMVFLKNYYVNNPGHHTGKKAMAMRHGNKHKGAKGQHQCKGTCPAGNQIKNATKK